MKTLRFWRWELILFRRDPRYAYITTKIAIELIRDSPEAAARVCEGHARRAVMRIARTLKDSMGRYVIP